MQPRPRRGRKRAPKPGYDQALKELLLASHDAFLALIAPGMTWVDKRSEELPAGTRRGKSRLMGLLGLLVGMRLPKVDLVAALERDHMIEEIWEESSYKDAVREHAIKKMAREMAQLALEGRFGELSEEMLSALREADESALAAIIAHITSDTPEQIRARLGLH